MTLDPAHQSTLVALAAIQREREELARYVARLRSSLERTLTALVRLSREDIDISPGGVWSPSSPGCVACEACSRVMAREDVWSHEGTVGHRRNLARWVDQGFALDDRRALAGEIEPQDPIADAAEDEAFRVAEGRMEAAEAREDAADAKAKGTA